MSAIYSHSSSAVASSLLLLPPLLLLLLPAAASAWTIVSSPQSQPTSSSSSLSLNAPRIPPVSASSSAGRRSGGGTATITTTTSLSMSKGKQSKSQQRTTTFLNYINDPIPPSSLVDASDVTHPPEQDDLAPLVRTIALAADRRKAEDVVALRVSKISALTTFLVFVSGNSRPQNNAIVKSIMDDVEEAYGGEYRTRGDGSGPEGTADSGWMVLDYGGVMVHVMTPKSRLFYDVEGQWRERGGEDMGLDDVLFAPPPPPSSSVSIPGDGVEAVAEDEEAEIGGAMGGLTEEEDPFWS